MHDSWPILIALLPFVAGVWSMKPAPADRIRRKITYLLEELNSRYTERMALEMSTEDGVPKFKVVNEQKSMVIDVRLVSGDDLIFCCCDRISSKHFGDVSSILKEIEVFLREYHRYHIAEYPRGYAVVS